MGKKRKKKNVILNIFIAAAFLAGAGIFFYPTFSDMWNQYRNALLISNYDQAVSDLSADNYEKLWKEAEEYNAEHPVNSIVDAFDEEEDYEPTHPYDEVLDPNGDGLMGSIEIPRIQEKLAIYHGLSKNVLEKGAGHVEGTSLPIGGPGTHAVLAAHRGLPSAKLFTDLDQIEKGDIFVVRPGESIPVDGKILEGHSAVNEAALTGESIPVDKEEGDLVSAATINQSGFIRCEATRVGEDTTLSQIIRMVSDAAATKAPIAKIADKVSGVFVPVVILIAVVTTIVWLLAGQNVGYALARGISVLVISCPCALGLATPVAIMVGNGMGAKNGILFKTAVSLEEAGRVQIVALDKTGTITSGEPRVTDLVCEPGYDEKTLLELAGALEKKSEHPLAKAVLLEIVQRKIATKEVEDFRALAGNGLTGILEGHRLLGGSMKYISSQVTVGKQVKNQAQILAKQGKTPLLFAKDDVLIGMIAVADVIKEDSPKAVQELQNMGIRVVMLTGDNEQTAKAIGAQAGVDQVIAGVLPDGKEAVIRKLKEYGKVAMVGDGINDAPALTRADIGIAIGAGADVAIDAADVVLMKSRLSDVPAAVRLSRATLRNIHENLFWAFFYNIIGIPLAAGVWIPIFGWTLNPMFGALAMSLSSFCVVSNALRLNLFKVKDSHRDHKIKNEVTLPQWEASKGEKNMTKTMTIKGMMCGHCEARVKKTLEELEHVTEAQVSHEKGTAVVSMETEVADEVLKKAVEDQGYQVENIQ